MMLQKLRRKFILINMLLVTAVLLIVFGTLCTVTWQRQQSQAEESLRRAVERAADPFHKENIGKPPSGPAVTRPVICVTVDAAGTVLARDTDKNGAEMEEELLNQAITQVLAADKENGVLSALGLRYWRQDRGDEIFIALTDRSGERQTMITLVAVSLLVGVGGEAAFFFISLFLSNWALRPVRRAWEQQRQFVADASHELKTPLTVILADTDILLAHPEDTIAGQAKWVRYIREESLGMKSLVDDMLFLAKGDAAGAPVLCERVQLSDVVLGGALPFESVAFERGVTLDVDVTPDLVLTGDEGQLRRLVRILLDNACKYAGDGGKVTLTLTREGDKARLTVRNTGAPIPPEHLPHVFERFYRADSSRSREQGGYGLGLAIAHSIVERHRGRITVTSREGEDTVFQVWLPLKG